MSFSVKILADSISTHDHRLTTFEVTFPRFILAELNTHRMFSRNSASSRAIPTQKIIKRLLDDPFVPVMNKRVKGMGVGDRLGEEEQHEAQNAWLAAMHEAIGATEELTDPEGLDVDKSRANRLLEPFAWHTAIVTATDWDNFFALRNNPQAQGEFQTLAAMMQEAYLDNIPRIIPPGSGELHLPLVTADEILDESLEWPEAWVDWDMWGKVSVGRCARVSYLTHDGIRDISADIALHDKLLVSRHLSPFEHVAEPFRDQDWILIQMLRSTISWSGYSNFSDYLFRQVEYHGNLHGWHSLRTQIPNEHDASMVDSAHGQTI